MEIKSLQVAPIGTNCYLVCDEAARLCAVVDPGGDADRIFRTAEQAGCVPACILLTHGHFDHIGAVDALRDKYPGIPVYMSRRDAAPGKGADTHLFPPLSGFTPYDDGDEIRVAGLTFHVLATPGHTPGSVTLRCGNALFTGDTLFCGSCGRTDFPGGSMEQMMDSLKKLASLEGEYEVYPGHMEASDLDRERRTNPYLLHALKG